MNPGKTILIADDNDDLRAMLGHQLQSCGYRILMAADGQQAVQKCLEEMPDLVLMDVMMPVMDGTEASATLKENRKTKDIPVIFLTSLVQGEEAAHGDDVKDRFSLPKSIDFQKLIYEIELALTKK